MAETKKEEKVTPVTFIFRNHRWECFYCGQTLDPDSNVEHKCPNKKLPVGDHYDSNLEA